MRKKLVAFLAPVFLLFACEAVHAHTIVYNLPSETILLKSPRNSYANWREVSRSVTENKGLVDYLPLDQKKDSWSTLIRIEYLNRSIIKDKVAASVEGAIEQFRETTLDFFPPNEVDWRLIEKNKSDAIYETITRKPFNNLSPEHGLTRFFLTDTGIHILRFIKKDKEMSSEERERCLKDLRDSTSVVSAEEAKRAPQALSLVERVKDSVNLGKAFEKWNVVSSYTADTGYSEVARVPLALEGGYVDECLEVKTIPNYQGLSLDQLFEIEKEMARRKSPRAIEFSILKRSPSEIIYSFKYRQDLLLVTAVVRTFLAGQGYYSLSYKRGLPQELKPDEIQLWKERLEAVKIRN